MYASNLVPSEGIIQDFPDHGLFFDSNQIGKNIKPVWSMRGHNNSIEGIHILNESEFVTVSHDCLVSFWKLENQERMQNLKLSSPILCSSYNKKKKCMGVGLTNKNQNIYIIDTENSKIIDKINSKSNSIFCLNYFEPEMISSGSKDGTVCIFDLNKKKNIYRYEEAGDCINSCIFNTDYNIHLFSTYNGNLCIFDNRSSSPFYKNGQIHSTTSINTLYSYQNYLFSGGSDYLIKKQDLRILNSNKPLDVYVGNTAPIRFLSFSSNHSFFCSSADNGSIKLWTNEFAVDSCVYSSGISGKEEGGKKKVYKKWLETEMQDRKKQPSQIRSDSIKSERMHTKSSFLRNSQKKNELLDVSGKRTLTPSMAKVASITKQQMFGLTNLKISEKSQGINTQKSTTTTSKNASRNASTTNKNIKGLTNTVTHNKYNIKIQTQGIPNSDKNNSTCSVKMKPSTQSRTSSASMKSKSSFLKSQDMVKLPYKLIQHKIEDTNFRAIIKNSSIVESYDYKTDLRKCVLTMLHHKNKVASIDWYKDTVLSVSWDQTIKCWNLKEENRSP